MMVLKYYIITMMVLGALLGIYAYTLSHETFLWSVPFSNDALDLPVAVYIAMIFYGVFAVSLVAIIADRMGAFIEQNALKTDKKTLIKKLKNKIIHRIDDKLNLKTDIFKDIGNIIDSVELTPHPHATCANNDIKKLLAMYENLQNGEEIDVHKFNIPQTSPLFTLNVKNSIAKNYKNGLPILKNKNYIYELKKCAFLALLNNADSKEIEKYKDSISYDREISLAVFEAYLAGKIELNLSEFATICKNAKFSKDDYLACAKNMKRKHSPNEWIRLFEYLADNDDSAEEAYLFVLLDLEMLQEAKNRLKAQPSYEHLNVRAYLDLKGAGKSYPTELFFR
ncbi:hypothetical protein [Helicobacter sp. 23-1045]